MAFLKSTLEEASRDLYSNRQYQFNSWFVDDDFRAKYPAEDRSGKIFLIFGGLAVLEGATGQLKLEAPGPESSPVSHDTAGCADVDGDGRQELAVAISDRKAEARLYRLAEGRLALVARAALGEARNANEVSESRLHAICDLDGDGKCELILSRCRKRMICRDPIFYPSTFDSCGLLVLDSDLRGKVSDLADDGEIEGRGAKAGAVFFPGGVSRAIVTRLNSELVKILNTSDMKERMAQIGVDPAPSTPEELAIFVKTDTAKYIKVAHDAGIKLE